MALLLSAPVKGDKGAAPSKPAKSGADDSSTIERTYFDQMKDAENGGEKDGEFNSLVQLIRECVKKELDEGY